MGRTTPFALRGRTPWRRLRGNSSARYSLRSRCAPEGDTRACAISRDMWAAAFILRGLFQLASAAGHSRPSFLGVAIRKSGRQIRLHRVCAETHSRNLTVACASGCASRQQPHRNILIHDHSKEYN